MPAVSIRTSPRASSLHEAAALAIAEFRRCGFTANAPGPATRLTVTVKTPVTSHEVRLSKIEAWLESGGRSPNEQALETRLRELVGNIPARGKASTQPPRAIKHFFRAFRAI